MSSSLVDATIDALTFTGRGLTRKRAVAASSTAIARGTYVETDFLLSLSPDQRARSIAIARTLAAMRSRRGQTAFGPSAALLHGIEVWPLPQRIHMVATQVRSGNSTQFPAVFLERKEIASATSTQFHRIGDIRFATTNFAGLELPTLGAVIFHCALTDPAESAFITLCQALRLLADSEENSGENWRVLANDIRQTLLESSYSLPSHTRGAARARWLIEYCDAGCDSVDSARLLWLLRSAGIGGLVTDYPVSESGGQWRVDIAEPDARLALSIGDEHPTIPGWTVLPFSRGDLDQPADLVAQVRNAIEDSGSEVTPIAPYAFG
ncbi:MAG: hypothetical protein Q4C87_00470 [Actinomycetaceae bacterium]|nr:hypothetical protein [Actinomycetaceae bacterium]